MLKKESLNSDIENFRLKLFEKYKQRGLIKKESN